MKRIIISIIILVMLLVSIGGCWIWWEEGREGGHDGDGGGHDRGGRHEERR